MELAEANLADGAESSSSATLTIPEDEYIYDFSFPRTDGKPNPHLWTDPPLARRYAEIVARRHVRARPRQRRRTTPPTTTPSPRMIDELDAAMRDAFATVPDARAAHLPRRLRLLRRGLRLEGDRRDPGVGLRGPDAEGGGRPDRAGRGRGACRRSSAPRCSRARCSSRSAEETGVELRRRAARRRPARRARRRRALVARADAVRLRDDDRGLGGDASALRGGRGRATSPRTTADVPAMIARPAADSSASSGVTCALRRRAGARATSTSRVAAGAVHRHRRAVRVGQDDAAAGAARARCAPSPARVAPPPGPARRLRARRSRRSTGTSRSPSASAC